MYELNICHLYPDLLNLYGDRGNIIAFTKRCQWRDIEAKVDNISIGHDFYCDNYDIIFIGGGQDYDQTIIHDDLMQGKRREIINGIEAGKVFLGICGGFQLLGKYYRTISGKDIECLGALDIWTHEGDTRLVGNLVYEVDFLKTQDNPGYVVGFENHSGRTYLGQGIKPLGKVIKGHGNNGEDGFEGAVYKNTFCTYSHGSLLPKNPALADHLIMLALLNKYPEFQGLSPLDNELENLALQSLIKRFVE